jgi:hypothetical protein
VELNEYEELPRPNDYDAVSIVLIVIGIVIACIGICGCCGAIKKQVFLLKMVRRFFSAKCGSGDGGLPLLAVALASCSTALRIKIAPYPASF